MVIGVTGTNGKTSTLFFLEQFYQNSSRDIYAYGTRGFYKNQNLLRSLVENDPLEVLIEDAIIESPNADFYFEAHSPLLKNGVYDEIGLDVAVLTQISKYEHCDYHDSYQDYKETKLKMFGEHLIPKGVAIVPYKYLAEVKKYTNNTILTFGVEPDADCTYRIEENKKGGVCFTLQFQNQLFSGIQLNSSVFIPSFCAAFLCAIVANCPVEFMLESEKRFLLPEGRYQFIKKWDKEVVVDFAHNPGGMLQLLRDIQNKSYTEVWTIFGCGGDRSKTKRPIMGKIAKRYSDKVILTQDNSRNEITANILSEIAGDETQIIKVPQRGKAIQYAVQKAPKGAVIAVLGMGDTPYLYKEELVSDIQLIKNMQHENA